MNMIESVECCFSKYATFEGNASRSEFWWFYLFYLIAVMVAITLDGNWSFVLEQGYLSAPIGLWETLVNLGFFIPILAVACRRLHDIGMSGWWQLIALTGIGYFLLIYWWCQKSRS